MTNLIKALIQFHSKVGAITKDAKNPFFNSRYADLSMYLEAVTPALCESGLCLVQTIDGEELVTTLWHESGESISSRARYVPQPLDPKVVELAVLYAQSDEREELNNPRQKQSKSRIMVPKTDPQSLGSALTYFRRYQLAAILSLAAQDDDGNAASEPQKPIQQKKPKGGDRSSYKPSGSSHPEIMEKKPELAPIEETKPEKPDDILELENKIRDVLGEYSKAFKEINQGLYTMYMSAIKRQDWDNCQTIGADILERAHAYVDYEAEQAAV